MNSDALNESRELRFWGKLLVDDIVRQICFLTLLHAVLRHVFARMLVICSLYYSPQKYMTHIYSAYWLLTTCIYVHVRKRRVRGSREILDSECKGVIDCSNLVGEAER